MSKNNKNNNYNKNKKNDKAPKPYKNPANTLWGKIIICILALAMALSGLITLIIMFLR